MITSLSQNTSSAAADFFSRIDSNTDGQLTADELKADFESRIKKVSSSTTGASGTQPTPDFAQMVSDGDTDGDGSLSEVEFTTAMQARRQGPPPPPPQPQETDTTSQSITDAISKLDTDGDGKLSADELLAAYKAKQTATTVDTDTDASSGSSAAASASDPDFASLISVIDTDGDGLLNTDEVTSLVTDSRRQSPPPPPPPQQLARLYADSATDGEQESATTDIGSA